MLIKGNKSRREVIKTISASAGFSLVAGLTNRIQAAENSLPLRLAGRVNHSVCRWCYSGVSLDSLCKAAVEIGLESIELLGINDLPTLKKYGLNCAMLNGDSSLYGITNGWNKSENHKGMLEHYKWQIDRVSSAGFNNIIVFSGNREHELSDEQGLDNCVKGLSQIMAYAEKRKVNLVMELLNSKIDHPNYMCDHTHWGVELCQRLGSENFKLLYDIYHMQIMEGDVIRTIRDNSKYIAHYHTGGVPGRNEIDDS